MKVAPYIRLSQEDQSSFSIDNQQRQINSYCQRYGLTIHKTYIDNGESSYTFDRKEFGKLEKDLKANGINFIIVFHLDRFSRNMAEAMLKIQELLSKGIRVRDVSEPLEMNDYDVNTFLLRSTKFMAAEVELRRIKERTRDGIYTANLKGIVTHKAPYGYLNKKAEDGHPKLFIEETKAEVIRFIFYQYLAGVGEAEIKRQAATKFGFTLKGNSAISRVILNPLYAGLIRARKELIKARHEPIVTESTFYLAQAKYQQLNAPKKHAADNNMYLKHMLYCHCGRCMTVSNPKSKSGKTVWYYLCPTHRKHHNANKLHTYFEEILQVIQLTESDIIQVKKLTETKTKEYLERTKLRTTDLQKELASLSKKILSIEKKYLESTAISQDSFEKTVSEYRVQKINIETELLTAERIKTDTLDKLHLILTKMVHFKEWFNLSNIEHKQKAIKLLFGGCLIWENEMYRTPYLDALIKPKAALLKQKRLLVLEKSLVDFPLVERTGIEHPKETQYYQGFRCINI